MGRDYCRAGWADRCRHVVAAPGGTLGGGPGRPNRRGEVSPGGQTPSRHLAEATRGQAATEGGCQRLKKSVDSEADSWSEPAPG